ncbi:hypothetical protein [Pseudomonas sp. LB3P25]
MTDSTGPVQNGDITKDNNLGIKGKAPSGTGEIRDGEDVLAKFNSNGVIPWSAELVDLPDKKYELIAMLFGDTEPSNKFVVTVKTQDKLTISSVKGGDIPIDNGGGTTHKKLTLKGQGNSGEDGYIVNGLEDDAKLVPFQVIGDTWEAEIPNLEPRTYQFIAESRTRKSDPYIVTVIGPK